MTSPARRDVITQAHGILTGFDAIERDMIDAALAAIADFLAVVRGAVMGLGGQPDLDAFPPEASWLDIAHRRLDALVRRAFTRAYLQALGPQRGDAHYLDDAEPFITQHIASVSDRLRDWPAGVFEEIRHDLHTSVAAGESTEALRDRIGATLGIDAPSREIRDRIAALAAGIAAAPDKATAARLRAERAQLHRDVRETDYAWQWRAERIARTELTCAVNGGTYRAHIVLAAAHGGELPRKQWVATGDSRVRPSHAAANGQIRSLEQAFDVGGVPLLYPGDPTGPPETTVNCRCTLAVIPAGAEPLPLYPIGDQGGDALAAAAPEVTMTDVLDTPAATTGQPAGQDLPNGWRGPIAPLGRMSGDGRIFADPGEALQVRPLPLPLLGQESLAEGHDGAVIVGLVDAVWIQDGQVWGEGRFDMADDAARKWARRLADGYASWVSVKTDASTMTEKLFNEATGDLIDMPEHTAGPLDTHPVIPDGYQPVGYVDSWRLMSVTLLHECAFPDGARVAPVYGYTGPGTGTTVEFAFPPTGKTPPPEAKKKTGPPRPPAGDEGEPAEWVPSVGDRVIVDDPSAGGPGEVTAVDTTGDPVMVTVQLDAGGPVEVPVSKVKPETFVRDGRQSQPGQPPARSSAALVRAHALRAAGTLAPPASWFDDPHLEAPTTITVDGDRVFGHLAKWGTCHIGVGDSCLVPPRAGTYAYFHVGEVLCAGGELIPVGRITLGTGHADKEAGYRPTVSHYDDTGTAVAVVRAYEDPHGIAVAGALCEGVTDAQVAALRRSPLSGDWRRIGGRFELVAALCVNVPGFPVLRPAAAIGEYGEQTSLVAAGILAPPPAGPPETVETAVVSALARWDRNRRQAAALAQRMADGGGAVWGRTEAALLTRRMNGGPQVAARAERVAAAHGYPPSQQEEGRGGGM